MSHATCASVVASAADTSGAALAAGAVGGHTSAASEVVFVLPEERSLNLGGNQVRASEGTESHVDFVPFATFPREERIGLCVANDFSLFGIPLQFAV